MIYFLSGSNKRFSWAWSRVNYDQFDTYHEDFSLEDPRSNYTEFKSEELTV